jgi:hypothetical protein
VSQNNVQKLVEVELMFMKNNFKAKKVRLKVKWVKQIQNYSSGKMQVKVCFIHVHIYIYMKAILELIKMINIILN